METESVICVMVAPMIQVRPKRAYADVVSQISIRTMIVFRIASTIALRLQTPDRKIATGMG